MAKQPLTNTETDEKVETSESEVPAAEAPVLKIAGTPGVGGAYDENGDKVESAS